MYFNGRSRKIMIMKIPRYFLVLVATFFSHVALSDSSVMEGEALYQTHCSACHGNTGGMDMSKRVAPPIIAVRMHYIGVHPDKTEFIAAVAGWLEKQDESNTLMPGAIRKFKIMPPVPIARADAEKIAAFIYEGNIEKPEGFDKHFEEMHGNRCGNCER
jgi:cytochrome c